MSAIISQRVFTAGGNTRFLSLLRDEYVRQMSIGNNWNRLHIGVLISVDASADFYGTDLRIGTCTYGSPVLGAFAAKPTNWIGMIAPNVSLSSTWTYVANAGVPYVTVNSNSSAMCYYRRAGTTTTAVSLGTGTTWNIASNAGTTTTRRTILIVQIAKGATTYSVYCIGTISAAQAQIDYTFSNLLEATQSLVQPPLVGTTALTNTVALSSGACSEAQGPFDAISIAWKSSYIPLSIYGIAVYRVF